jgi:hypothetical protein
MLHFDNLNKPAPYFMDGDGAGLSLMSLGIKDLGEPAPTVGLLGENETALP